MGENELDGGESATQRGRRAIDTLVRTGERLGYRVETGVPTVNPFDTEATVSGDAE